MDLIGLYQVIIPMLQAVVNMHRIVRPQPQRYLQYDGPRVLGVQQPGAPQLSHGAPGRPRNLPGSKGAVEVPQVIATGGVGAAQLVRTIRTVSHSIAKKAGGQTASGPVLRAREVAKGAGARRDIGGRWGAGFFICGIAAFIIAIAPPNLRKALPIFTQEFPIHAEVLAQPTCKGQNTSHLLAVCQDSQWTDESHGGFL